MLLPKTPRIWPISPTLPPSPRCHCLLLHLLFSLLTALFASILAPLNYSLHSAPHNLLKHKKDDVTTFSWLSITFRMKLKVPLGVKTSRTWLLASLLVHMPSLCSSYTGLPASPWTPHNSSHLTTSASVTTTLKALTRGQALDDMVRTKQDSVFVEWKSSSDGLRYII